MEDAEDRQAVQAPASVPAADLSPYGETVRRRRAKAGRRPRLTDTYPRDARVLIRVS